MNEFKKRVLTSIPLLIILYLSLVFNQILLIALIFISFILIVEFNHILTNIFNKNKFRLFLSLLVSIFYTAIFSSTIWFFAINDTTNKTYLILIFTICISTDIGGYIFGKTFKGKKLTNISPNKTYSGLIGSYLLSFVSAYFLDYKIDFYMNIFIYAFLISTISQLGDLLISYLKRHANIKDTGRVLPGHGGLLDRIDGIIFAIPFGVLIMFFE